MVEMFPIFKIVYFQNEQDNLFSFFFIYLVVESNLVGEISDFPPNFSSNVYNFSHIHADV